MFDDVKELSSIYNVALYSWDKFPQVLVYIC